MFKENAQKESVAVSVAVAECKHDLRTAGLGGTALYLQKCVSILTPESPRLGNNKSSLRVSSMASTYIKFSRRGESQEGPKCAVECRQKPWDSQPVAPVPWQEHHLTRQ